MICTLFSLCLHSVHTKWCVLVCICAIVCTLYNTIIWLYFTSKCVSLFKCWWKIRYQGVRQMKWQNQIQTISKYLNIAGGTCAVHQHSGAHTRTHPILITSWCRLPLYIFIFYSLSEWTPNQNITRPKTHLNLTHADSHIKYDYYYCYWKYIKRINL